MKDKLSKMHLDLSQGVIEVEGTEEFVTEQFEYLRKLLSGPKGLADVKPGRKKNAKTKVSRKVAIKKEIDLKGSGNTPSLLEFYDKARRPTFLARSILFLYYLKNVKNHKKINTAHIKVCYGAAKASPPSNMYQNVIVGGGKKKWVDVSNTKDLQLTPAGIEEVEKNLLVSEKRATKKKVKPTRKNKARAKKKVASPKKKKAVAPKKAKKKPAKK